MLRSLNQRSVVPSLAKKFIVLLRKRKDLLGAIFLEKYGSPLKQYYHLWEICLHLIL